MNLLGGGRVGVRVCTWHLAPALQAWNFPGMEPARARRTPALCMARKSRRHVGSKACGECMHESVPQPACSAPQVVGGLEGPSRAAPWLQPLQGETSASLGLPGPRPGTRPCQGGEGLNVALSSPSVGQPPSPDRECQTPPVRPPRGRD